MRIQIKPTEQQKKILLQKLKTRFGFRKIQISKTIEAQFVDDTVGRSTGWKFYLTI